MHRLTDLIDTLGQSAHDHDGDKPSVDDLLDKIGGRGHGPLLFLPGFLAAAPTGAIPGVAIGMAVVVILISVQMIFSPRQLWLPSRLRAIDLDEGVIDKTVRWTRPTAGFLDRFLNPRLQWMFRRPGMIVLAGFCLLMGALMMPLAFVPFAASVPGSGIALAGIAITSRDGIVGMLACGLGVASIAFAVNLYVIA